MNMQPAEIDLSLGQLYDMETSALDELLEDCTIPESLKRVITTIINDREYFGQDY